MNTATAESPGARLFREAVAAHHLEMAAHFSDCVTLARAGHDHVLACRYAGRLLDELVALVALVPLV